MPTPSAKEVAGVLASQWGEWDFGNAILVVGDGTPAGSNEFLVDFYAWQSAFPTGEPEKTATYKIVVTKQARMSKETES